MLRRNFLTCAAASSARVAFGRAALSPKERVDRALAGQEVDRPPFTFWHHFGLKTAEAHAARTLEFHRLYHTDLVKVMSDFPYPKPPGKWYELKVLSQERAAQVAGLSRAEFLDALGRFGVSPFQYGPEEVLEEAGLE